MNGWIVKFWCKNMLISSKNSPPRLVYDCRNSPPLSYYCWRITVSISISWSYHMLRNIQICSGKESTQFALLRWERITSCVPYRCVCRGICQHRVGWVMVAGTYMLVHNTTDSGLDADQGRTFLWKYRLSWHGMQMCTHRLWYHTHNHHQSSTTTTSTYCCFCMHAMPSAPCN